MGLDFPIAIMMDGFLEECLEKAAQEVPYLSKLGAWGTLINCC